MRRSALFLIAGAAALGVALLSRSRRDVPDPQQTAAADTTPAPAIQNDLPTSMPAAPIASVADRVELANPSRSRKPPASPFLSGRLLDATGVPVASGRFDVEFFTDAIDSTSARPEKASARTDSAGYFRTPWPYLDPERRTGIVKFRLREIEEGWSEAIRAFPLPLTAGDTHLDDVQLVRAVVIVAGRVVDEFGAGRDAKVVIERLAQEPPFPDGFWEAIECSPVKSGADGQFLLRALPPKGLEPFRRLRAIASRADVESAPVEFTCGERGLTLFLPAVGRIAGHLRLGNATNVGDAQVWLRNKNGTELTMPGSDGDFLTSPIAPGSWVMEIRAPLCGTILRVTDVLVVAHEVNRDPRLSDLSLDGLVALATLTVVSSTGGPVDPASVELPEGKNLALLRYAGHWDCLVPVDGVDAEIGAYGYRTVTRRVIAGPNRIVLEPESR